VDSTKCGVSASRQNRTADVRYGSLADIEPHPCLLYPRKRTLRNTVGAKHCWDVHFVPIVEIDPGRRTPCKMGYSYASTCKPRLESGLSGIALLL